MNLNDIDCMTEEVFNKHPLFFFNYMLGCVVRDRVCNDETERLTGMFSRPDVAALIQRSFNDGAAPTWDEYKMVQHICL